MNIAVRVILVLLFVPALIGIARVSDSRVAAVRTLAFIFLVFLIAFAIFFPASIEKIASVLELNSGLDLVVYSVTLAFATFSIYSISRVRKLERKIVVLAQELAILKVKVGVSRSASTTSSESHKGS